MLCFPFSPLENRQKELSHCVILLLIPVHFEINKKVNYANTTYNNKVKTNKRTTTYPTSQLMSTEKFSVNIHGS